MIDLQLHSLYSDGTLSPEELVKMAVSLKLTAIALTDHDTVDGIPTFMIAGKKYNITTIPGLEISVKAVVPPGGHIHILGLFINHGSSVLSEKLAYLREKREARAAKIVGRLQALKIPVTMDEVIAEADGGAIGRPHIGRLLAKKRIVRNIQQAFEIYLGNGKPAYVDKVKLDEKEAIQLISDAGGLSILAHPHLMNYPSFEQAWEKILYLKSLGLDGVEAYYSAISPEFSTALVDKAVETGLALSGGSDFHGANKEEIAMGTGMGNLHVPDEIYTQLRERWLCQKSGTKL